MNFLKTIILSLTLLVIPSILQAQGLSSSDIKYFRNSFLQINKNKFFELSKLQDKADKDFHYKILLWHQLANPKSKKSFIDIVSFLEDAPNFPKKYILTRQAEYLIPRDTDRKILENWFLENPPSTIMGVGTYIKLLDENLVSPYLSSFWLEIELEPQEEIVFYNKFRKYLSKSDVIARVDKLLWQGKTINASKLLHLLPKSHLLLSKARIALRRNYRNVNKAIDIVPKEFKNHEALVFERTKWRRKKKKYSSAIELLDSEYSHQSHPELWWEERLIIVRHLLDKKDYQKAYDITVKGDNSSKLIIAENQWLAGWIAYRFLSNPKIALGHFLTMREFVQSFISKARGDYWIARTYESLGEKDKAYNYYKSASKYSTTFYGQQSIEQANIKINNIFSNKPELDEDDYQDYKDGDLAKGIAFLSKLKLPGLLNTFALRAFIEAEKESPKEVLSLVKFMREQNLIEQSVWLTRRARTAGIDVGEAGYPFLKNVKYPKDSDKALIHAIVRQESDFNPYAKSPAGARGLMQIMPSTARQLSQWKRLRYSLKRLTNDINYNITLGEYFLWRLLRQYEGSYIKTFAAYNAGAGNVRKWNRIFSEHKKIADNLDEIDWIESIPFDETRNYVQRVYENYYIYKKLFEK